MRRGVLLGVAMALALAAAGASRTDDTTAPTISKMHAEFVEAERATHYTVVVTTPAGTPTATWTLKPPEDNPTCTAFAAVPGAKAVANGVQFEAVWKHADADGCSHASTQHLGTVTATVKEGPWICKSAYLGTLTNDGPAPGPCARPSCEKEKEAVAAAKGKIAGLEQAIDALRKSQIDPAIEKLDKAIEQAKKAAAREDSFVQKHFNFGSVLRDEWDAEAALEKAGAELQKARDLQRQLADQLRAARAELDAAEKALEKCLNGGTALSRETLGPGGVSDCSVQGETAAGTAAQAAAVATVAGRARGLVRASTATKGAVAKLSRAARRAAALPQGRAIAQEIRRVLVTVEQAGRATARSAQGSAKLDARSRAAKQSATKAETALAECRKAGG